MCHIALGLTLRATLCLRSSYGAFVSPCAFGRTIAYASSPPEEKSWIGRSILLNSPLPNKEGLIILQSIILFLYLRALRRCYTGAVGEVHPFADCMRLQGDNTPAED